MLKSIPTQIILLSRSHRGRRNLGVLFRFFFFLAAMITVYSIGFHVLMEREGKEYSWITGFYWTLTVMSTLGFGDITFETDLGRLFSILVLFSGTIFLLVLLPFMFIEFFYEPWMKMQAESQTPRELPAGTHGHVLLTNYDAVTIALIRRLEQYDYQYALLVADVDEALRLHDLGVHATVGDFDDPETWSRMRVESAALVASSASDARNTNIAFTVRGIDSSIPIITTASDEDSVHILKLAGSNNVLRLEETMGRALARRTLGGDAKTHLIGEFDQLLVAEASAHGTPLVGKSLSESKLRQDVGVSVVGVWERGQFEPARGETMINESSMLLLAGSKEHFAKYDEMFSMYSVSASPVLILGGGRVGRAVARAFDRRKIGYKIVEMNPDRIGDPDKYVLGSAADRETLEVAGIAETSTVIITTHDDDLNVYLTIYCRRLRPDIQILGRATHDRNVATMHRAGADSVLSYASIGASAVMNMLQRNRILMVAEGLDIFEVRVPPELAGKTIAESSIRERTGCSVVAIRSEEGMFVVPGPTATLPADVDIVIIGTVASEQQFLELFGN